MDALERIPESAPGQAVRRVLVSQVCLPRCGRPRWAGHIETGMAASPVTTAASARLGRLLELEGAYGYGKSVSESYECSDEAEFRQTDGFLPVGPTMLWWEPPRVPADIIAHTAVVSPIDGVASEAMAREIDSGMNTCGVQESVFSSKTLVYSSKTLV